MGVMIIEMTEGVMGRSWPELGLKILYIWKICHSIKWIVRFRRKFKKKGIISQLISNQDIMSKLHMPTIEIEQHQIDIPIKEHKNIRII